MSRALLKVAALALVVLGGCTTPEVSTITNVGLDYRPIIDSKGVDIFAYEKDVAECKEFAAKLSAGHDAAVGAAAGAIAGAAAGAAIGAAAGDARYGAAIGAAAGGVGGSAGAGARTTNAQMQIIRNCIAGRGYKVLY